MVPMASVHSEGVPFGNFNNPKPKKIGYWKLVSSSMPNVEIFTEFDGETIFEIRPKVAGKSLENLPHGQLQAR